MSKLRLFTVGLGGIGMIGNIINLLLDHGNTWCTPVSVLDLLALTGLVAFSASNLFREV